MRGKPLFRLDKNCCAGITPAHAGKTWASPSKSRIFRDHPRACGENLYLLLLLYLLLGSPPRMRGKPGLLLCPHQKEGITPAHAGKTSTAGRGLPRPTDHPRACGENAMVVSASAPRRGSPPRMRGKLRGQDRGESSPGITPAHAGKTIFRSTSGASGRDHPRACGENSPWLLFDSGTRGSPPRMRGKLEIPRRPHPRPGITPAHAGKTS